MQMHTFLCTVSKYIHCEHHAATLNFIKAHGHPNRASSARKIYHHFISDDDSRNPSVFLFNGEVVMSCRIMVLRNAPCPASFCRVCVSILHPPPLQKKEKKVRKKVLL